MTIGRECCLLRHNLNSRLAPVVIGSLGPARHEQADQTNYAKRRRRCRTKRLVIATSSVSQPVSSRSSTCREVSRIAISASHCSRYSLKSVRRLPRPRRRAVLSFVAAGGALSPVCRRNWWCPVTPSSPRRPFEFDITDSRSDASNFVRKHIGLRTRRRGAPVAFSSLCGSCLFIFRWPRSGWGRRDRGR